MKFRVGIVWDSGEIIYDARQINNIDGLEWAILIERGLELPAVEISFALTSHFRRKIFNEINLTGKKVNFYLGDTIIWAGKIESWAFEELSFRVQVKEATDALDNIIGDELTSDEFPNLPPGNEGAIKPIALGRTWGEYGGGWLIPRIDSTTKKFFVANHLIQELEQVYTQRKDGISSYTIDETGGVTTLTTSATVIQSDDLFLRVRGWGLKENGSYVKNVVDGFLWLLSKGNVSYNQTDFDDVKNAINSLGISGEDGTGWWAFVIDKKVRMIDIINSFAKSYFVDMWLDKDGILRAWLDFYRENGSIRGRWNTGTHIKIFRKDYITQQFEMRTDEVTNWVIAKTGFSWADRKFLMGAEKKDEDSIALWGERKQEYGLQWLVWKTPAWRWGEMMLCERRNPIEVAILTLPEEWLQKIWINSFVWVELENGITGSMIGRVRRIKWKPFQGIIEVEIYSIEEKQRQYFRLVSKKLWENMQYVNGSFWHKRFGALCRPDGTFSNGDPGKVLISNSSLGG